MEPDRTSAVNGVEKLPQDLILVRHVCLNRPIFPTLLRNFRHGLLTERHPSGLTSLLPNLLGSGISKDLYFFDNHPFTD